MAYELEQTKYKISPENHKLGRLPSFSIPHFMTCPGSTPWCRQHCYVQWARPTVKRSHSKNYRLLSSDPEFAVHMVQQIEDITPRQRRRDPTKLWFRIHSSGDFFSEKYIDDWIYIITQSKKLGWKFWAYTRSWWDPFTRRQSKLMPALERLRALDNMVLYASTDRDTGPPPAGWREAGIDHCYSQPQLSFRTGAGQCPAEKAWRELALLAFKYGYPFTDRIRKSYSEDFLSTYAFNLWKGKPEFRGAPMKQKDKPMPPLATFKTYGKPEEVKNIQFICEKCGRCIRGRGMNLWFKARYYKGIKPHTMRFNGGGRNV